MRAGEKALLLRRLAHEQFGLDTRLSCPAPKGLFLEVSTAKTPSPDTFQTAIGLSW